MSTVKSSFTLAVSVFLLLCITLVLPARANAAYLPECGNVTSNANWWSNVKTAVTANAGTDPDFTSSDLRMILYRAVSSTTAQIFIASPGARINLVYRDTNNAPQLEFHTPNAEFLYRTNIAADGTATTNFYSTNTGTTQQSLGLGAAGTGSCIQGYNNANVERSTAFFSTPESPYFPYANPKEAYMTTLFPDGGDPCQYNASISELDTGCEAPEPETGDFMTQEQFVESVRLVGGEYAVKAAALTLAFALAWWTVKQFGFKQDE